MDLTNFNKDRKPRRKTSLDLGTMVFGKVPPQAKELEEAVLGAILLERDAFDKVAEILKSESFYVEAHQRIFTAMTALVKKSQPIDTHTVSEQLRSTEELDMVGGSYYLTKITNTVVSSANIESHCKILLQKYIQRELIRICGEVVGSAYEDSADPLDLLDQAEEAFSMIGQAMSFGDMVGIDKVLVQAIQKIEEWRKLETNITGVASGFRDLDKATRGWQNGDLIIIAARPSVGKTALALNIVRNAANHFLAAQNNKSVAVWSLEMRALMLVLRMLAAESKEVLHRIQTGRLDNQDMKSLYVKGVQKLSALNIFFDDRPGLTIQKLRSKARKLKRKNDLGLIIVDYLQLMTPDEKSGNREQEVSKISRNLKYLAQELDIPIIALSQMSREFEKRTGHHRKPQLSDLRESGSLEQDADVVIFLWGPTDQEIEENAELLTRRYLRIAKQRNGVLISMDLDFKDEIQLFSEIQELTGLPGNYRRVDDVSPNLFIEPSNKKDDFPEDEPLPF